MFAGLIAVAASGLTSAGGGAVVFRPARLRVVLSVASAPATQGDKQVLRTWAERSDDVAREDGKPAAGGWQWRAVLMALSALWASNPAAVKIIFEAAPELPVSEIMALRFGIAAVALLPFLAKNLRVLICARPEPSPNLPL